MALREPGRRSDGADGGRRLRRRDRSSGVRLARPGNPCCRTTVHQRVTRRLPTPSWQRGPDPSDRPRAAPAGSGHDRHPVLRGARTRSRFPGSGRTRRVPNPDHCGSSAHRRRSCRARCRRSSRARWRRSSRALRARPGSRHGSRRNSRTDHTSPQPVGSPARNGAGPNRAEPCPTTRPSRSPPSLTPAARSQSPTSRHRTCPCPTCQCLTSRHPCPCPHRVREQRPSPSSRGDHSAHRCRCSARHHGRRRPGHHRPDSRTAGNCAGPCRPGLEWVRSPHHPALPRHDGAKILKRTTPPWSRSPTGVLKCPATSYSPTGSHLQYHRR